MKLSIISSNILPISKNVKKGTELFVYLFTENLVRLYPHIQTTLFTSGDSQVSTKIISINKTASFYDQDIGHKNHKLFELALISKAISKQEEFDLFHIHIGNGEVFLPFALFTKKPILITLHSLFNKNYQNKYFSLFNKLKNIYFISISNSQRKPLSFLNYYRTIYHGINTNFFNFNEEGGNLLIWAGRGIPQKGLEKVLKVAEETRKPAHLFIIRKEKSLDWLKKNILEKAQKLKKIIDLKLEYEVSQEKLAINYQKAKLFLNPLQWEEPFGLVMIESMACGTPIVAFARGSVPEVIKDGETGFIVNPSDNDIRGDWIIKKTGIEGLCEAVERIYSMKDDEYQQMRRNCRAHVEKNFTVERMVDDYVKVYQEIIKKHKKG